MSVGKFPRHMFITTLSITHHAQSPHLHVIICTSFVSHLQIAMFLTYYKITLNVKLTPSPTDCARWFRLFLFFIHLKLELLMQIPASNDEKMCIHENGQLHNLIIWLTVQLSLTILCILVAFQLVWNVVGTVYSSTRVKKILQTPGIIMRVFCWARYADVNVSGDRWKRNQDVSRRWCGDGFDWCLVWHAVNQSLKHLLNP